MKSIIFGFPPWAFSTAIGAFGCMEVALEEAVDAFDWGNTPDPYAKAYRIGARKLHSIWRNASLNSSLINICWLTPKFW